MESACYDRWHAGFLWGKALGSSKLRNRADKNSGSAAEAPGSIPGPCTYEEFRTGYTYADVYYMIYNRKHKRRNGVLGFWRELKLKMYAEYLRCFHDTTPYVPNEEPIPW